MSESRSLHEKFRINKTVPLFAEYKRTAMFASSDFYDRLEISFL